MHYRIDDYLIESELAAKSTKQTNKTVLEHISKIPSHYKVLDYGCGKLRYSIPLAQQASKVIAIDSIYQIEKIQIIADLLIAPKDYTHKNLIVQDVNDDEWKLEKYDAIFCVNVLSAVPTDDERLNIICNAKKVIKANGYLFIVVQYRNSYFSQYEFREDTIQFNDGWLIKKRDNKCSFYGLVTTEKIIDLCNRAGFKSYEITKHDGSCFIKAYL